jgi:translation initiation factor IF-1
MQAKKWAVQLQGRVISILVNARFKVRLDNGHELLAHVSGKIRKSFIRILPGDVVTVEVSPDDLNKGRIVYPGTKGKDPGADGPAGVGCPVGPGPRLPGAAVKKAIPPQEGA